MVIVVPSKAVLGRDKARCLVGTSPHLPRLEPCLRLLPHTAQHFQISLSFCSVVFGAEYLKVFQAVCILWSFEPCIGFDVVNLYFPWVESFLAPCTDGAVPEEYLFPQVSLSWPAFASVDVESRRSEEHTSELQSPVHLVCRLLLEKKKQKKTKAD